MPRESISSSNTHLCLRPPTSAPITAFLQGKRQRAMKANSSSEEKSNNVTHTMTWGVITKSNYKFILEVSVFSFIWYAHSFIAFFPFSWFSHAPGKAQADACAISPSLRSHGCYCAIDMKRPQKYSSYYYSVWSVRNSKLLEENVNQWQIFRANPVMQPTGITGLLWKTFSLGGRAGHSNVFMRRISYGLYMDCWWKPLHICLQKCFI